MKIFFITGLLCLVFAGSIFTADDPAKGHYDSALFFLQEQKFQQAVDDLQFIVKSFSNSPLADDALLQLGLYYLNQEKKFDEALQSFQQIKDRYTNSNSAPAAYYYIGQIHLTRGQSANLDEAYANFERVTRVFPSSEWVDKSLVGAGMALKGKNQFDKAYEEFAKVKIRFADSPLAPLAQYQMGMCSLLSDAFQEATFDFQQLIDRFPESPFAARAKELNTILYRLYIATPANKNPYAADGSFNAFVQQLDDPTSLAFDSKGNVYLSDKGKKAVYVIDQGGKTVNSMVVLAPTSVSLDESDQPWISTETGIVGPNKNVIGFSVTKDGKPQPLSEIRSVAVSKYGEFYVVSGKVPGIHIFDSGGTVAAGQPFSKTEREYQKVLLNSRNQLYALDKQRKQLTVYAPDGSTIFGISPGGKGYSYERIEDYAIDRANHIYLLTKNPRAILIFSPTGNFMKYVPSDKKGAHSFEDGKLLAVGPDGAIYVLDKDQRRIIKLG